MTGRKALLVVDLQNDFLPGGALPVPKGNTIIAPINRLVARFEQSSLPVVFTRDWHPKDHYSFEAQGGPWPPHCVQHTRGAQFPPSLDVPKDALVIAKATKVEEEAYSGFQGTELGQRLREAGVTEIFVCGLATDYCVKKTALDALALGFSTSVVTDCIMGLDDKDTLEALALMAAEGARMTTSKRVRDVRRRVAVSSSS